MIGTNTIIFLTGMATLDPALVEAARVDGAEQWRIFIHITLPLLKRFVQFAFVITVISCFSALFSLIFVMTGGGPGYGTTTLEFFVYQSGFSLGQFGTAALYGIILFVIMTTVGLVQLRLIRLRRRGRPMSSRDDNAPTPLSAGARARRIVTRIVLFAVMVVVAVVMLYPFWLMIDNAFRTAAQFDSAERALGRAAGRALFNDLPVAASC